MKPMTDTPQYRMPAEWAPHAATWIAWPHNPEDWPGKFQPIPWVYCEIVRHLSRVEDVHILVNDVAAEKRAYNMLRRQGANLARLHVHTWRTDRVWLRDSGPIFVRNAQNEIAITDWKFNAWAKYSNHFNDDQIPAHVAELYAMPSTQPHVTLADGIHHRLVLEGGSIDTNGTGILLTTEECLLSDVQQRNPGVSREQLEQAFHDHLGIDQVLWLNRGCAGDDTHGHVDDITRFVGENTILTVIEPNTADENHLPSPRTSIASTLPATCTAGRSRSKPFPCPHPSSSPTSAFPPPTPTSTSRTASFLSPPSTTPTIASPSTPSPTASPTAPSPASTAPTSSGASVPFIA